MEVESERRDAAMLRNRDVVARKQETEPRIRAAARPHLLTADPPLVAVARRTRLEPGEVRPGARLREQLAPDLLAARDRSQPPRLLFGATVGEQRRTDELEPDEVRVQIGYGERRELAAHDADLLGRRVETSVLLRPRGDGEPRARECLQIGATGLEVVGTRPEHRCVQVGAPGRQSPPEPGE